MAFSSQRTNVPPRVLSLSLEVQGLFQGLMLGRLLDVCLSGIATASSGKHTRAHSIITCFSHREILNTQYTFLWQIWVGLFLINLEWINEISELTVKFYSCSWKQHFDKKKNPNPKCTYKPFLELSTMSSSAAAEIWDVSRVITWPQRETSNHQITGFFFQICLANLGI